MVLRAVLTVGCSFLEGRTALEKAFPGRAPCSEPGPGMAGWISRVAGLGAALPPPATMPLGKLEKAPTNLAWETGFPSVRAAD